MSTAIPRHNGLTRRLDIQGLRGLAVIPGFLYHMTESWLPGSMVFIDMFFAVSGYLITARLIELAQSRSVRGYYYDFYRFRVKRLLPASLTVIVVTTALSWLLFVPTRAHHITVDAESATFFFANIRYAVEGTNYFHRSDTTTPLLPFWSLSLEEQFYVVWPVLVIVLIWWGAKRSRQRPALVGASVLILVTSFAFGFWFTRVHQVAAYYDTMSRAWDFAVGMLLAIYAMRHRLSHTEQEPRLWAAALGHGARRVRDSLNRHASLVSWFGALLFFFAVFVTPTTYGFPVPWGAIGVAGAALVIFAGIDQPARNRLLDNRFSVKMGDLSYSIYLVHFPVFIFAAAYLSGNKSVLYLFDVVAVVGLALLLYHFVEEPGRRGFTKTRAWFREGLHRPVVNAVAVSATVATIVFAVGFHNHPTPLPVPTAMISTPTTTASSSGAVTDPARSATPTGRPATVVEDPTAAAPTATLRNAIIHALTRTSWPRLTNVDRVDNVGPFLDECQTSDPAHVPCVAKPASGIDPAKVAVAMGDSTMLAYWPMLRDALVPHGWTVVMFAHSDCTAPILSTKIDTESVCRSFHASYSRVLEAWRPHLAFLSGSEFDFTALTSVVDGGQDLARTTYLSAMRTTIDLIRGYGAAAVVMSPPPAVDSARTPGNCLVAGAAAMNCTYAPQPVWQTLSELNRQATESTGTTYADLMPFFCIAQMCPGAVDHVVVHADRNHITPEYSSMIAPSFADFLAQRRLL